MSSEVTFALVVAAALLVVLVVSYVIQQHWNQLLATGGRASGVVVRHNVRLGRNTITYSVIRFTTSRGVVVEAEYTNGIATSLPSHQLGQRVRVAYDQKNPADFIVW